MMGNMGMLTIGNVGVPSLVGDLSRYLNARTGDLVIAMAEMRRDAFGDFGVGGKNGMPAIHIMY